MLGASGTTCLSWLEKLGCCPLEQKERDFLLHIKAYARHFSGAMFRGSCLLSNEEFLVPLPATSIRLCSSAGFWFLCLHLDWSASCIQTHFVLVLQVCASESTTELFGTGFFNTAALGVCQLCGFSSPVPRSDPFPST